MGAWNLDEERVGQITEAEHYGVEDEAPTTPVYVQRMRSLNRTARAKVIREGQGTMTENGNTKSLIEDVYHLLPSEFDQWQQAKESGLRDAFAKFDKRGAA